MPASFVLRDEQGNPVTAISNSFGFYHFEDAAVGQNYVLTVSSKRHHFQPRLVLVNDEIADLDLVAVD